MDGHALPMSGRSDGPAHVPAEIPHLWTIEEANGRVADLGQLLDQLRSWASRLHQVHAEIGRLQAFWGPEIGAADQVDHELSVRLERENGNLSTRLEEAVVGLQSEGIEIKDLSSGLVDFYAVRDGELVLLCWRLGEPEVGFYHTLTGGFAGRRPLVSSSLSSGPGSD